MEFDPESLRGIEDYLRHETTAATFLDDLLNLALPEAILRCSLDITDPEHELVPKAQEALLGIIEGQKKFLEDYQNALDGFEHKNANPGVMGIFIKIIARLLTDLDQIIDEAFDEKQRFEDLIGDLGEDDV
jgi:hypothetical protein